MVTDRTSSGGPHLGKYSSIEKNGGSRFLLVSYPRVLTFSDLTFSDLIWSIQGPSVLNPQVNDRNRARYASVRDYKSLQKTVIRVRSKLASIAEVR